MTKINVLDSKIYNRIAAGEVVERPSSVLKELVENSIDAGASVINVSILGGGKTNITVEDNGVGVYEDDLRKALLPHATSKISKVEDLDSILTLGFRGEALASIGAVSKLSIISKPKDQPFGAKISCDGGIIGEISPAPIEEGTIITVDNLFFNTPVRERFLKSEKSEETETSEMMLKLILSNPNVAFKYVVNDKTVYQTFGDGLESAIICVYGAKIIDNCYFVDTIKNGIAVKGYISRHNFTKSNRNGQSIFINGRYVQNTTISSAIMNAYSAYLMKRQYPFYVLHLTIPTEIVDVNVHPNKTDVRFSNNQVIYGTLYSICSKVLDGTSEALEIIKNDQNNNLSNYQLKPSDLSSVYVRHNNNYSSLKGLSFSDHTNQNAKNGFDKIEKKMSEDFSEDIFAENKAYLKSLEKKKQEVTVQTFEVKEELKYVGQVLNTYLIFESGENVYIADQHAAHERMIYDELLNLFNENGVTQDLLLPYVIDVNHIEEEFVLSKIDDIKAIGIGIEKISDGKFSVYSLPVVLCDINVQAFFDDVLNDMESLKTNNVPEAVKESFARKACRAAIKAGYSLNEQEIKVLTQKLNENLGLKCPHGRPVVVKITRNEIDKWFKRIL
ncbi:MAG: DNA mismatch repair endonuclease MutL [Clostridiales bacterium]|nr:DNA mismatch repair endonuclease MutL [Clostridiales bacterium]